MYVEAKYRVYNHFLKNHIGLDDVPFNCKLCQFRCFRKEELDNHVTGFPRHRFLLQEKEITTTADMLVINEEPYLVTGQDIVQLSELETQQHWRSGSKTPAPGGNRP